MRGAAGPAAPARATEPTWPERLPHGYPEVDDALRFTRVPGSGPHMETLTFRFPTVDGPEAILAFQWGTTIVEIPIGIEEGDG